MPPPPVNLKYKIGKYISKPVALQLAALSSVVLDQGELALLMMTITFDAVTDMGTHLERNLTLSVLVPDFEDAFGPSENPAVWNLSTLWGQRIEKVLNTALVS